MTTYPAITSVEHPSVWGGPEAHIAVSDGNDTRETFRYEITADDRTLGLVDMHRNAVRAFLGDLARYVDEYIPGYVLEHTGAMSTFVWVLLPSREEAAR